MGQQQLLLLVLGIVIVGLAVVTGIQVFSVNQKQANGDALLMTGMRIATDLQVWLRTPTAMGGGLPATGGIPDIKTVSVTLADLGYPLNGSGQYETVDGMYTLVRSSTGIVILGLSGAIGSDGDNNTITIEVKGTTLDDITTTRGTIAGF